MVKINFDLWISIYESMQCVKTPAKKALFEVFQVRSFNIRSEYGDLQNKSPYSVWMRENTDQENEINDFIW